MSFRHRLIKRFLGSGRDQSPSDRRTGPKRFMICGMPRTGSTLLLASCQKHPEVEAYGEIFHQVESERKGRHAIKRPDQDVYYKGVADDAIEFLEREVWPFRPERAKAMGFKLFGEYIRCAGTRRLFTRLSQQYPDLHIIHIVRPNTLDAWVSRQLAIRSGEWERFAHLAPQRQEQSVSPQPEQLSAPPIELKQFFHAYRDADQFICDTFSNGRYLQITYDALATDYHSTIQKVFQFLGVSPFTLSPPTEKQNKLPASKLLSNYVLCARFFEETPYSKFFVDISSDTPLANTTASGGQMEEASAVEDLLKISGKAELAAQDDSAQSFRAAQSFLEKAGLALPSLEKPDSNALLAQAAEAWRIQNNDDALAKYLAAFICNRQSSDTAAGLVSFLLVHLNGTYEREGNLVSRKHVLMAFLRIYPDNAWAIGTMFALSAKPYDSQAFLELLNLAPNWGVKTRQLAQIALKHLEFVGSCAEARQLMLNLDNDTDPTTVQDSKNPNVV